MFGRGPGLRAPPLRRRRQHVLGGAPTAPPPAPTWRPTSPTCAPDRIQLLRLPVIDQPPYGRRSWGCSCGQRKGHASLVEAAFSNLSDPVGGNSAFGEGGSWRRVTKTRTSVVQIDKLANNASAIAALAATCAVTVKPLPSAISGAGAAGARAPAAPRRWISCYLRLEDRYPRPRRT